MKIERETTLPIYIETNVPMQCFLIMKGSNTTHLTITYNKDFLSQASGMCVLSVHNQSGTHIGTSTFDHDGKHELGTLFNLFKSSDRFRLEQTIMDFIKDV